MDHVQSSPEWQMFTVSVYLTQLIFSPARRDLPSFCTENILSCSSPGKAWYLTDTAKQTRNTHMHTTKHTDLPLSTKYWTWWPCTIKKMDFFFLLPHNKIQTSYWSDVKIREHWTVMQDHARLRQSERLKVMSSFKSCTTRHSLQEICSVFTGPPILPVPWPRRI